MEYTVIHGRTGIKCISDVVPKKLLLMIRMKYKIDIGPMELFEASHFELSHLKETQSCVILNYMPREEAEEISKLIWKYLEKAGVE